MNAILATRMQRHFVLTIALILAMLVGMLHTLAIHYYLYWRFPYFDMLPHSAAGIMVGILLYFLARHKLEAKDAWWLAFLGAIAVGIAWEFFEYGAGVTKNEPGIVFDTLKDLTMDTLGGLLGATFAYKNRV